MNEKRITYLLNEIEENRIPSTLDLWLKIRNRVKDRSLQKQRKHRVLFALMITFFLTTLMLWAFSPGFWSATAQTIERLIVSISGGPGEPSLYSPAPPFTVFQPKYLPEGFRLTENKYQSAQKDLPSIKEEAVEKDASHPGKTQPTVSTVKEPSLAEGRAYILQKYTKTDGHYFYLFERAADDEALPTGEILDIAGHPARLEQNGMVLRLIWIDAGTWIELEGTLTANELLKVAEGLVATQEPEINTGTIVPDKLGIAEQEVGNAPPCDPSYVLAPNDRPLLGKMQGQSQLGSLTIYLWNRESHTETIDLGASVPKEEIRDKIYEPALQALQALQGLKKPLQQLSYPTIGIIYTSESGCWGPPPDLQGYIRIEVWDYQVNVGYGGTANLLMKRAIIALYEEMKKTP